MYETVIALIIIGFILIVVSYFISEKINKSKKDIENKDTNYNQMMNTHLDNLTSVTNEKMMAISEYSDFVLKEIDKQHKEIIFLYQMLNDKEKEIKTLSSSIKNTIIKEKNQDIIENSQKDDKNSQQINNELILRLHSEGYSGKEIAKELGLGIGEVKLVIDLYKEVHNG